MVFSSAPKMLRNNKRIKRFIKPIKIGKDLIY